MGGVFDDTMNLGSALAVKLLRRPGQVRILSLGDMLGQSWSNVDMQVHWLSSAVSGSHTPEGSFSSRLHHLLTQKTKEDAPGISQARSSFIKAVGLSSPQAKDGVPSEVPKVLYELVALHVTSLHVQITTST